MSPLETPLARLLGVRYALVQAPMANVQPPALAAVVSNAGALGSIAGATVGVDDLRAAIRRVREATTEPFAVNLFAPPYADERKVELVLDERVPVFSFTFGTVDVAPFHAVGTVVLGTATTVAEARELELSGVDVVVAQAAEAGGHRGTFLGDFDDALVPLAELVPAVAEAVGVPVVAAGGLMDGAGVAAALALGAAGVQLGTAFLFTPECAAPPAWLDALSRYETTVTAACTGRPARLAQTPFVDELLAGPPPLPYPQQRQASLARARSDADGCFLGGAGAHRARTLPAAELVRQLVAEAFGA